jgi:hypothetical protein
MKKISRTIQTKASPAKVLDWFAHFEEHYVEWWPEAHKEYRSTSEGPPQVGSTFELKQETKGRSVSMKGVITKMEPAGFEWKMKPLAVMSGSWGYRPLEDGGTEIMQTMVYGPAWPVVGGLVTWIMGRLSVSAQDVEEQLGEEMARLKQTLEAAD